MRSKGRFSGAGQICLPGRFGWRGAGLGNEIFPWAKAYLAGRELGFKFLPPAWGLNRRAYWREFGTSRLDWIGHAALQAALPVVTVTDDMVRSTGEVDYGAAVRVLDQEYGWSRRRPLVLVHQGMSGGHLAIERARNYLRNGLLGHLPEGGCADRDSGAGQLRVAVHARLGDFSDHSDGPLPGVFNRRLPVEWYRWVLTVLQDRFGEALHIDIVSDEPAMATRMLSEWNGCAARPRTILEDLSVMAAADLLVCSVSTFSMLAAFLSDAPYVWYQPHLHQQDDFLSIWGYRPDEQAGGTGLNIRTEQRIGGSLPTRGTAVAIGDELPPWLTDFLDTRAAFNRRSGDLVRCGVVPQRAGASTGASRVLP